MLFLVQAWKKVNTSSSSTSSSSSSCLYHKILNHIFIIIFIILSILSLPVLRCSTYGSSPLHLRPPSWRTRWQQDSIIRISDCYNSIFGENLIGLLFYLNDIFFAPHRRHTRWVNLRWKCFSNRRDGWIFGKVPNAGRGGKSFSI